jgi:hypothetical protein
LIWAGAKPVRRWLPCVTQEKAAAKERELREAEARARTQQSLTESELSIATLGGGNGVH